MAQALGHALQAAHCRVSNTGEQASRVCSLLVSPHTDGLLAKLASSLHALRCSQLQTAPFIGQTWL